MKNKYDELSPNELKILIKTVFHPTDHDKQLGILIDLPDDLYPDTPAWQERRLLAYQWSKILEEIKSTLNLSCVIPIYYQNVHNNNADLPETAFLLNGSPENFKFHTIKSHGRPQPFKKLLAQFQILLAPTEFSATAPLKILAKELKFRAATMPGFSKEMIPALRLNYQTINSQVLQIKKRLDSSTAVTVHFFTEDYSQQSVHFDLRFRESHASGGLFHEAGSAGNLPSGECYIVPYEGEREEPSRSNGFLPVQFEEEIVIYRIVENRAIEVTTTGFYSTQEMEKLKSEPAYGNIAEIGFGVLRGLGIHPLGEILIDEKLGLHIAFGRSDHFGGSVGVQNFSTPDQVIHIDRIYIPETQNKIGVDRVILTHQDQSKETIIRNGEYTIF